MPLMSDAKFYVHVRYSMRNMLNVLLSFTLWRQVSPVNAILPKNGASRLSLLTSALTLRLILTFSLGMVSVCSLSPQSVDAVDSNLTVSASQVDRPGNVSQPDDIDVAAISERRKQAQTDLNAVRESFASKSLAGAAREELARSPGEVAPY